MIVAVFLTLLLSSALLGNPLQNQPGSSSQSAAPVEVIHPVYPADAILNREHGIVVLNATIAKDGSVKAVQVVSGPMNLRKDSLRAVAMWRYAPQLVDGKPTEVQRTIRILYTLEDPKSAFAKDADLIVSTQPEPLKLSLLAKAVPLPSDRVRLVGYKAEALVVHRVEPVVPPEAKKNGITGNVLVRVVIDKSGKGTEIKALGGAPMLVPAAEAAVTQWTFKPYSVDGVPKEVDTAYVVSFQ